MSSEKEQQRDALTGAAGEADPKAGAREKFAANSLELAQAQSQAQADRRPIGIATRDEDGTIRLKLSTHGAVFGEAEISYTPDAPQYQEILRHLGGIKSGETKEVMPWLDRTKKPSLDGKPDDGLPGDNQTGDTPGVKPEDKPAETEAPPLTPSQDFTRRVNEAYENLPQNVKDALSRDGVSVVATDKVTDLLPHLKNQKPRGWPPGSTWDDVDGAYEFGGKRIIVAERQQSPSRPNRVEGLTRHETGHAVDHIRAFSDTQAFIDAYQKEAALIPKPGSDTLKYFLQKDEAGREEAFAEIFAIIHGGGTTLTYTTLLNKYFPETIKVVKNQVANM
jgi:hypothetical protein